MKIAIIYAGQPSFTKGLASYVYEKCRRMQENQNEHMHVDCYMLRNDYTPTMKFLLKKRLQKVGNRVEHESECKVKGVTYKCLWRNYGFLDNLFYSKLGIRWKEGRYIRSIAGSLKDYDVICTHKTACHQIGVYMKRHYGIPFIATWHGSDINVYPYEKCVVMRDTIEALEEADMNLFVSKGLMQASYKLTNNAKCDVIYTGAAKHFCRYTDEERQRQRKGHNVEGCKVVSFVGNLVPVKNVMVLPAIFSLVSELYKEQKLIFWIIGNGELEANLKNEFERTNLDVRFLGRIDSFEMPNLYNCINVNVLPSINEGFPLVNVEARTCGVNVVGSNVGGIPESIGQPENCFALDMEFVENVSRRIVEILTKEETPKPLPKEMSWDYAIEKEISLCKRLAGRK